MKNDRNLSDYLKFPTAFTFLVSLTFLVFGAFILPTTYDETARIIDYNTFISGVPYDYHWPLGLLWINFFNPIYDGSVLSVRLFSIFLAVPFLFLSCNKIQTFRHIFLFLSLVPIVCAIVSTATPQGYMLSMLGVLLLLPSINVYTFPIFSALYLINPTCIVLVPLSLFLSALQSRNFTPFKISLVGYIFTAPIIFYIYQTDNMFLPTFSTNGLLNLFLGNNPHPLSYRGVGTTDYVKNVYMISNDIGMADAIRLFFVNDPALAVLNFFKKLFHFWAPWDYLRSGFGGGLQYAFFVYVGFVQLIIFQQILSLSAQQRTELIKSFAFIIIIVSCLIYSIFFVKLRFRLPFDVILLISICFRYPARKDA